MRRIECVICMIGAGEVLRTGIGEALATVTRSEGENRFCVEDPGHPAPTDTPVLARAVARARAFFARQRSQVAIRTVQAETVEAAISSLSGQGVERRVKAVCLPMVQARPDESPEDVRRRFAHLRAGLQDTGWQVLGTHYANIAWFSRMPLDGLVPGSRGFTLRVLPEAQWVLVCDLLCLVTDFLQLVLAHPLALHGEPRPVTLGVELARFLDEQAPAGWDLSYFTGSMVQSVVRTLEGAAADPGLRGPSEHSLACGAIANWMLGERSFVTVVTSGMLDEFRGTLANLRDAGAKGFILCAENEAQMWFAFQGTLSAREDMRDVIAARGLGCVFLEEPDRLAHDLAEAFALYESRPGPTVLLATQRVLEHTRPLPEPVRASGCAPAAARAPLRDDHRPHLEEALRILREDPVRVLWQCGPMDEKTLARVLSIAERSGIALADSLTHPGTVPAFRGGERVPHYLGPLGIYGFGKAVYEYLCAGGKIRPLEDQAVFFLGSSLEQAATPFAPSKLRSVQVVPDPGLLAPFAEHPIQMDAGAFVEYVDTHLVTDASVRAQRLAYLEDARRAARPDLAAELPSTPMSPNYFFRRLDALVQTLIRDQGYAYTGVYEVGRCGASALRNVARTGRGFSGWFGRALMGDALMASIGLAQREPGNVVVFSGDGARALVPDVLSPLAEAARAGALRANNLTVLCFLNGALSLIQSYQEGALARSGDRQVQIANVPQPERDFVVGDYAFRTRLFTEFDEGAFRAALTEERCVNLYSVVVDHNNVGDGMSVISERGWQCDSRLAGLDPVGAERGRESPRP